MHFISFESDPIERLAAIRPRTKDVRRALTKSNFARL